MTGLVKPVVPIRTIHAMGKNLFKGPLETLPANWSWDGVELVVGAELGTLMVFEAEATDFLLIEYERQTKSGVDVAIDIYVGDSSQEDSITIDSGAPHGEWIKHSVMVPAKKLRIRARSGNTLMRFRHFKIWKVLL